MYARSFGIAAFLSCVALGGAPEFHVHDAATVVFYGDSITSARLYTVYTEAFVLTRFPRIHANFVHSGWSGDRVSGGGSGPIDVRLDRDVFAYNPTVITIMLGMNDGEYHPFDLATFERFKAGYRHILDSIEAKAPHARVTALETSPYDDVTRPPLFIDGYNSVLLRYAVSVREMCAAKRMNTVDLNTPAVTFLKAVSMVSPKSAQTLIPDRVHPSPGVHLVMAAALLRAWNAPSVVSAVEIDASTGAVVNAQNTAVDSLQQAEDLSWTQTDRALPMPVEADEGTVALALRFSDFTDALNQETLKITGLAKGSYRLQIDEETVGTFDARTLAKGLNLAIVDTPMSRQARTVLDLTYRHNHLRYAKLSMIEQALQEFHPAKLQSAVRALDDLHDEIVAMQRAVAIPKPHLYRLTRLSAS